MFPLEHCIEEQLREIKGSLPTLIFPEACDPRILSAASGLIQHAKIVLVCHREDVEGAVERGAIDLKVSARRFLQSIECVWPPDEPELLDEFARELVEKSAGRSWEVSYQEALELVRGEVYFSILAVRRGYADAVLGGVVNSSRDFFRPCLRILERDGVVYEMGLFALPDSHAPGLFEENLVMFADVALNPEPDAEALSEIAVGACATMRNIIPRSILPQVNGALLSYSTRGSGAGSSVDRIRKAEILIDEKLAALRAESPAYEEIHIATELQIGCAISKEAARTKLGTRADANPAVGAANVLIAPNLDTGNLLYHIYDTRFPDARPVLVIGGLRNQALDFSRGSRVEDIEIGAKALMLRMCRSGRYAGTPNDRFFPRFEILTINPTRDYTEVGIWHGRDIGHRERIVHSADEIASEPMEQLPARLEAVRDFLERHGADGAKMEAVVGRGGLLAPLGSGTYRVSPRMLEELGSGEYGDHVVNLGAILAREVAGDGHGKVWVVDPAVVDELDDRSRLSGLKGVERDATWHALSQKAVAKQFALQHGEEYEDLNLIVAHVGGGVSIGAHRAGRCVQVNNALFEGPISLERAGAIGSSDVIDLCYSGLGREEVVRRLTREAGMRSYLGTTDFDEMVDRARGGDPDASLVIDAFAEQVASHIAALVPKFDGGPIDQVILTGELTTSRWLVDRIEGLLARVGFEFTVYPGDLELDALRDGALRVLRGVEDARDYL